MTTTPKNAAKAFIEADAKNSKAGAAMEAIRKVAEENKTPTGRYKKTLNHAYAEAAEAWRIANNEYSNAKATFVDEYMSGKIDETLVKERRWQAIEAVYAEAARYDFANDFAPTMRKRLETLVEMNEGRAKEKYRTALEWDDKTKPAYIDITKAVQRLAGLTSCFDAATGKELNCHVKIQFDEWGYVCSASVHVERGTWKCEPSPYWTGQFANHFDFELNTHFYFQSEGLNFATYGTQSADTYAFEAASRIIASKFVHALGHSYKSSRDMHEEARRDALKNAHAVLHETVDNA